MKTPPPTYYMAKFHTKKRPTLFLRFIFWFVTAKDVSIHVYPPCEHKNHWVILLVGEVPEVIKLAAIVRQAMDKEIVESEISVTNDARVQIRP